jgi:hypothetical protein
LCIHLKSIIIRNLREITGRTDWFSIIKKK